MKTRYVIPVAAAVTLHALLLFGFRRVHPAAGPTTALTDSPRLKDPPMPVDLRDPDERIASSEPAGQPKGSPDAGRPLTEDRSLRPSATDFPQAPVVVREVPVVHPTKISPGRFGAITGSEDGVGSMGVGPIDFTKLDHEPRVLARISPRYPEAARHDGRTGEVLVSFIVDETGRVHNPEVVRASDPIFEEATLRAVAQWRFEPGKLAGRPVRFRMAIPVRFSLDS